MGGAQNPMGRNKAKPLAEQTFNLLHAGVVNTHQPRTTTGLGELEAKQNLPHDPREHADKAQDRGGSWE